MHGPQPQTPGSGRGAESEGTRAGCIANPISSSVTQFPPTSIDNNVIEPATTVKELARRSQDCACTVLRQKIAQASDWNTMQTRVTNMLACGCARTRVNKKTRESWKTILEHVQLIPCDQIAQKRRPKNCSLKFQQSCR